MTDVLMSLPWGWIAGGGALVLLGWLLRRRRVALPTGAIERQIEEAEREADRLERPGGARSSDDAERVARGTNVLRNRRSRER